MAQTGEDQPTALEYVAAGAEIYDEMQGELRQMQIVHAQHKLDTWEELVEALQEIVIHVEYMAGKKHDPFVFVRTRSRAALAKAVSPRNGTNQDSDAT